MQEEAPEAAEEEGGKKKGRGNDKLTLGSFIELVGFGLGAPVPSSIEFDNERKVVKMEFEANNFDRVPPRHFLPCEHVRMSRADSACPTELRHLNWLGLLGEAQQNSNSVSRRRASVVKHELSVRAGVQRGVTPTWTRAMWTKTLMS